MIALSLLGEGDRVFVRPRGHLGDRFGAYLRAIAGARFEVEGATKRHVATVDRLPAILTRLRDAGFAVDIPSELQARLAAAEAERWVDLQAARGRLAALDAELSKKCSFFQCGKACGGKRGHPFKPMGLRDYQKAGSEWLAVRKLALLADEMGTGKGVQSLCAVPAGSPLLVIAPASMKGGWVSEIRRWRSGIAPFVIEGRKGFRWPKPGEAVIANFDILPAAHKEGCPKVIEVKCGGCDPRFRGAHVKATCPAKKTHCPGCAALAPPPPGVTMIVDEAHACKNPKANRSQSTKMLRGLVGKAGGACWPMTGTPVINKAEELWDLLMCFDLAHDAFGSFDNFVRLYGGVPKFIEKNGVRKRAGFDWGDPLPEAASYLQRVCLRRMQKDVMKDMPPMTVQIVPVDIDKRTLAACDSLLGEIGGADRIEELLGKKTTFKTLATVMAALASAKIPALLDEIVQYEEAEEPVVVFSKHRAPVDILGSREGWAAITGDVTATRRTEIVEAFQAGRLKGLAATITAGGVGITLTRGAFMVFCDQEWTPALNSQAIFRLVRHGQTRPVLVKVLSANHPLDQRINEILSRKLTLIEGAVDAAREVAEEPEEEPTE